MSKTKITVFDASMHPGGYEAFTVCLRSQVNGRTWEQRVLVYHKALRRRRGVRPSLQDAVREELALGGVTLPPEELADVVRKIGRMLGDMLRLPFAIQFEGGPRHGECYGRVETNLDEFYFGPGAVGFIEFDEAGDTVTHIYRVQPLGVAVFEKSLNCSGGLEDLEALKNRGEIMASSPSLAAPLSPPAPPPGRRSATNAPPPPP